MARVMDGGREGLWQGVVTALGRRYCGGDTGADDAGVLRPLLALCLCDRTRENGTYLERC